MHYYQFNISDFAADVMNRSRLEQLFYIFIQNEYIRAENEFISVECAIRACGARTKSEVAAVQNILNDFYENDGGRFRSSKNYEIICAYRCNKEKNAKNGKKGGRPRLAEDQEKPTGLFLGSQSVIFDNQLGSQPITNNQETNELITNKPVSKEIHARENPATETSAPLATPAGVSAEKTPLAVLKKATKPKPLTLLPADFGISEQVAAWAIKNGHTMLDDRLEHFRNWATAGAKRYADWDAAFRNAIAGDWAHINDRKPAPITGRPQAFKPSTRQSAVAAADDAYELIFKEKRPDTDDDKQIIQGVLA